MLNVLTHDTLYEGRLALRQPRKGYRVSVDSLLLTYFATSGKPARRCADLGSGCGAVGIGLLLAGHVDSLIAIEIQERLSALAVVNAELNKCASRFEMMQSDVRSIDARRLGGPMELVVCNPPFWPTDQGRPPSDQERRIACQETLGTIEDWTSATARLLHPKKGRAFFVFPSRRLDDFLFALKNAKLSCSRLRFVHSIEGRDAELFLAECSCGKLGRIAVEPPIFLKHLDGRDTDMAIQIVSGSFSADLDALPDRRID